MSNTQRMNRAKGLHELLGAALCVMGLNTCGGQVASSSADGDENSPQKVALSGGAPAAHTGSTGTSGANQGGTSASGLALGSAGAWNYDGGSPSSGDSVPSASTGDPPAEPGRILTSCMSSDYAECGDCTEANNPRVLNRHVRLTTQAQVDALEGVVEITGNLTLEGDESLKSLHALCCLRKVGGSLVIQWMYDLGNVDGLASLTSIGGELSVTHSNCTNNNLKGLGSVRSVGGDFEVEKDECFLLARIGIQNIAGHITRTSNEICTL